MSKAHHNLLICDEMIIPIQYLGIIIKHKDKYQVIRVNSNGGFMAADTLSEKGFIQMKENLLKENHYKEKIRLLEQQISRFIHIC